MYPGICSWGFHGRNAGMVCQPFLQWTVCCQSYRFIHSFIHSFNRFIELLKPLWPVKTVIHEGIRKTLESPLDSREIKTVHLKGNQPSIFTGRIDTEAEAPYIGHLM